METVVRIFESETVLVQEHEPTRERRPLVPVDEGLILGEMEDIRRREVAQIVVLGVHGHILCGMHRRLQKPAIAQSAITAVPIDLIRVDGDDFLDCQEVDVVGHFASFFSVAAWRLFTAARLSFSVGLLR